MAPPPTALHTTYSTAGRRTEIVLPCIAPDVLGATTAHPHVMQTRRRSGSHKVSMQYSTC